MTDGEGSAVQYRFRNTTLGLNSGWLSDPTWTNSGLAPGTTYQYTVQSRDTAANLNESAQSSPQSAATLDSEITIVDSFTFNVDAATSATYSSNPGSDAGSSDDYTANSPMTIPVSGFTAAGTSKLVAVVSLDNSSRPVAPVTEITYGGVSIIANVAGGNSPAGATSTRQMVFYLDNVATDGNLVLTWDSGNVDEVSVALFALNGAQTGTASYSELKTGNATLSAFNATQGDFLVGVGQRNNGTNSVASGVGYTAVDLLAGNLNAEAAYKIATSTGSNSAPTFSSITSTNGVTQTMVAFAAIPVSQVAVPVVVGLTQAAAESAITGATLTVGTVTTDYSPTVPSGDVISQNPLGGVNVNVGSSVDLVVSLGPPPTVNVPDVVGLAQAAAESAIAGATLTVGTVTTSYSPTVPSGDVISQNPLGGVNVNAGSSVDLVVSLGPPPTVNVPDVVGLAQAAAESAITGASLAVGAVTYQNDAVVPAGDVISQNPTAGAFVVTGSSVDLVVSLGPPSGLITIVDTFSFSVDAGNSATYSSSPGSDGSLSDLYGADNPLTISTTGFTAAGTDKLVAVLSVAQQRGTSGPGDKSDIRWRQHLRQLGHRSHPQWERQYEKLHFLPR